MLTPRHPASYRIQVVEKAVAVLLCFLEPPHRFGVSEVARLLGLNKNQAFRILATLEQSGLVTRKSGDQGYRLAWNVVRLGEVAARAVNLRQVAQSVCTRLQQESAETVHLVAFDGTDAVCVDRWDSPQMIKLSSELGQRFPLHAGATPKTILAWLPSDVARAYVERDGYIKYTAATATSWEQLERELMQIRQQGFALSLGDVDDGAYGVGAPILDGDGKVIGAVSIAGPAYRLASRLGEFATMVCKAAADICAHVGGVPV